MILLARKYSRLWKQHAWSLGLIRRGRERRQGLARSMQSLAKSTQQRQEQMSRSTFLDAIGSGNGRAKLKETSTMPPPAVTEKQTTESAFGL